MSKLIDSIINFMNISILLEEFDEIPEVSALENDKYEGITVMTDYFKEHLKINEVAFANKFNALIGELISYFSNNDALMNQMPSQFSFNKEFKKKFLNLLPVSEEDIRNIIDEWNTATALKWSSKKIQQRTIDEHYTISFPYLYLALTAKDKELSMNILLMLNLLMYSMTYAHYFPKYNYIKDKGQYVMQNIIKKRGFGKYNSIYDLISKLSSDTYDTYVNRVTDRKMYEALWSNMQVKLNYYMDNFYKAYQSAGSVYLTTSKDLISTSDREGNSATVETNIENNSVIVLKISKDVTDYVNNPSYIEYNVARRVLSELMGVDLNGQKGNNIDKRSLVERNLYNMIQEIQRTRDFETIISNILQNFLWIDETTVRDIETPKFTNKIIYDLSYVGKNKIYINNIIKLLDKYIDIVLEERGKDSTAIDNKTLQKYRKAIIYYFALLIQQVAKRS